MEAPTLKVEILGQPATLRGFGTYRGPFDHGRSSGWVTWHDGTNRREPKTTASLSFDNLRVNGVLYRGRIDFVRSGYTSNVWRWENTWIGREPNGGDPTPKARTMIREAAEEALARAERERPEFFRYTAQRYAIEDERARHDGLAAAAREAFKEHVAQSNAFSRELAELEAAELVALAAEATETIDPDELERHAKGVQP